MSAKAVPAARAKAMGRGSEQELFFARLAQAPSAALLLDYDGTLAPLYARPQMARPYPGLVEALDAIITRGRTRVVVLSGRRAEDLASMLPCRHRPELWGSDGYERLMPDGRLELFGPPPGAVRELSEARQLNAPLASLGARIEYKRAGIAVHWRGLPVISVAAIRDAVRAAWAPLSATGRLELKPFDGGVELSAREANKQHVVFALLAELPPETPAAYLGDDENDEEAFRAVRRRGLAVQVRVDRREPTAAALWIRPPRELIGFLRYWSEVARSTL